MTLYALQAFAMFSFFFLFTPSKAQTTNISGIINIYTPVVSIGCNTINVVSAAGFSPGDKVLVIQMKGATVNTTNTSAFGDIVSLNDCGNFEFAVIASISGTTILLTCPLFNSYTVAGRVQLIKVPQYVNALVTDTLTCQPWNGSTGGVLVFEASNTVTLNSFIKVSGKGFRGGTLCSNPDGGCPWMGLNDAYFHPIASGLGAEKGEGITELPLAQQGGRGKQGNGGGGGNKHNTGGGGGGNHTAGGKGGMQASFCATDDVGGLGGTSLPAPPAKIFMGGGGGSADYNNGVGTYGGNGGGIVIIKASQMNGGGQYICSNGDDVPFILNGIGDGAGGGGAGGSILLEIPVFTGLLTVEANGGDGGDINTTYGACFGPGGGGGNGVLMTSEPALLPGITLVTNAGLAGIDLYSGSPCAGTSFGAQGGTSVPGLVTSRTVAQNTVPYLIDVTITASTIGPCAPFMTLTASSTIPGVDFLWSTGQTTDSINITAGGSYIVTASDAAGCTGSDTISILFEPGIDVSANGSSPSICTGDSVHLFIVLNNGINPMSIEWAFNSSTSNAADFYDDPLVSTTYHLEVTDPGGCTDTASFYVEVIPGPGNFIIAHTPIACASEVTLLPGITDPAWSYSWSTTQTTPQITVNTSGTYTLTITNAGGQCTSSASITLDFAPAIDVSLTADQNPVCSGTPVMLQVVINNGQVAHAYQWTGFSGTESFLTDIPTDTTTYQVLVQDTLGCTDTAFLTVAVVPVPDAGFSLDTMACAPLQLTFSAFHTGYDSYTWDPGDGTEPFSGNPANHTYNVPGIYDVSLQVTADGCTVSDTAAQAVTVVASANAAFTTDHGTDEGFGIHFIPTYPGTNTLFTWNFGDGTESSQPYPFHSFESALQDSLLVCLYTNNALNCPDTFCLEVDRFDISTFYLPNAFTPQHDGLNEALYGRGTNIKDYVMQIYDRWGEKIFETTDMDTGWDGTYRGKPVQADVYIVRVQYTGKYTGQVRELHRHVTLIR